MKKVFLFLLLVPVLAQAEYGLKNFKPVMPGVLYRGGGNGEREPMSSASRQGLCAAGFSSAYYLYNTGWQGESMTTCAGGSLRYDYKSWDRSSGQEAILTDLYRIITEGRGPMYVHCWYGVHASGLIAAIALKQFCGYSDKAAVDYWDSHVPRSIRYPKVQEKVRAFRPDPRLEISAEQRARVCP